MPTFLLDGVKYAVTVTQRQSALERYRAMDDHGLLGMVGMVEQGTMRDPAKIEALIAVCVERKLAKKVETPAATSEAKA